MSSQYFYDDTGQATLYNGVPLRTIKRAFFKKGSAVFTLMKLVLNSVTYDFRETAENGAVICPKDYRSIQFISPDDRIDYDSLKQVTLKETLDTVITICETNPIPSWDKFAEFLGSNIGTLSSATANMASVTFSTVDGATIKEVSIPDFTVVNNAATLFLTLRDAIEPAWADSTLLYELDDAAFGFVITITSVPDENGATTTFSLGFMFRE